MEADETHSLGYERVDDDPNVSVLLTTMEATGRWEATLRLRAWERAQLSLRPGQRLLDVGCGLGDAALAFADDLGIDGEIVGIDVSSKMIAAARSRGRTARCRVRFSVGDAHELDEPGLPRRSIRTDPAVVDQPQSGSGRDGTCATARRSPVTHRFRLVDVHHRY